MKGNLDRPPHDTGLSLRDLREDRPVLVHAPWGRVAVAITSGRLRCFQAFCPHMEGPLFEGSLARDEIVCPWHAWRFRLGDGRRVDDSEQPCPALVTLRAFVGDGGRILVEAPPEGTVLP